MDKNDIKKKIEEFMHPTVFTGVKPILLIAEELAVEGSTGDVIDAVWVNWTDETKGLFQYITKFAVKGEIKHRNYHTLEDIKPFGDGVALANQENLEKMAHHRFVKQEIKETEVKRSTLRELIQTDFENILELLEKKEELFLFKKYNGDWSDPFSDIRIDLPFQVIKQEEETLSEGEYYLKDLKTGRVHKHSLEKDFYAYIVGSKADIVGLELKNESYKKKIQTLTDEARTLFRGIEWLTLKDFSIKSIHEKLPQHPFDNYFNYVKRGQEKKVKVEERFVKALELIVTKHMPKQVTPVGIEYLPIDNLLYLFHEVIPRAQALVALESCDVIHEPSGLLLGFDGKRETPPKFLVSLVHIVSAYGKFPAFIEACERYLRDGIEDSEVEVKGIVI